MSSCDSARRVDLYNFSGGTSLDGYIIARMSALINHQRTSDMVQGSNRLSRLTDRWTEMLPRIRRDSPGLMLLEKFVEIAESFQCLLACFRSGLVGIDYGKVNR